MKFIKIIIFILMLNNLNFVSAEGKNFAVCLGINTLQLKYPLTKKIFLLGTLSYGNGILVLGIKGTKILKDYTKTNFYLGTELNKLYFHTEGVTGSGFMINVPLGCEYFISKKFSLSNELSVVGSYIETKGIKVSQVNLNFMYNIFFNFYF